MADVKQVKKIVPLITCEIPFCQYVCKLVFGVNVLVGILWSTLILSNIQSRATLWVLDTCLIVGLLPSLFWKMWSIAPNKEDFAFDGERGESGSEEESGSEGESGSEVWRGQYRSDKIVVLGWNLLVVLVWCGVARRVSSYLIFGVDELVWKRMKHFYNQIPKIKSWNSIRA